MILERLRRGERIEHYETVRVTKAGRRIDVSLTISPVRDGAGRIIGASKIARDVTARKRAEQRLGVAEQRDLSARRIREPGRGGALVLRSICESLDWHVGALWQVDEPRSELRCAEIFHVPSAQVARFEAASREIAFARGVGLPGRVWASGAAAWIPDVARRDDFPRADVARKRGLQLRFGFPIIVGQRSARRHGVLQPRAPWNRTRPCSR